eukprot:TRINITY_DN19060_c0_g1_i2.p1 TRINITY_DN19060_c0_g1~~TRINITY_DN19060_c0_g1_i2.p1  ORF type:complete len:618 (+),score=103.41 TRINITY_DN19060_c0_g1_i2:144-1856(+)
MAPKGKSGQQTKEIKGKQSKEKTKTPAEQRRKTGRKGTQALHPEGTDPQDVNVKVPKVDVPEVEVSKEDNPKVEDPTAAADGEEQAADHEKQAESPVEPTILGESTTSADAASAPAAPGGVGRWADDDDLPCDQETPSSVQLEDYRAASREAIRAALAAQEPARGAPRERAHAERPMQPRQQQRPKEGNLSDAERESLASDVEYMLSVLGQEDGIDLRSMPADRLREYHQYVYCQYCQHTGYNPAAEHYQQVQGYSAAPPVGPAQDQAHAAMIWEEWNRYYGYHHSQGPATGRPLAPASGIRRAWLRRSAPEQIQGLLAEGDVEYWVVAHRTEPGFGCIGHWVFNLPDCQGRLSIAASPTGLVLLWDGHVGVLCDARPDPQSEESWSCTRMVPRDSPEGRALLAPALHSRSHPAAPTFPHAIPAPQHFVQPRMLPSQRPQGPPPHSGWGGPHPPPHGAPPQPGWLPTAVPIEAPDYPLEQGIPLPLGHAQQRAPALQKHAPPPPVQQHGHRRQPPTATPRVLPRPGSGSTGKVAAGMSGRGFERGPFGPQSTGPAPGSPACEPRTGAAGA